MSTPATPMVRAYGAMPPSEPMFDGGTPIETIAAGATSGR